MAIGAARPKNPASTMSELARTAKKPKVWAIVGISGIVGAFLILSFYSVIGGWSLYYTVNSVSGAFSGQDADGIGALFNGMLSNPGLLLLGHSVFMLLVIGIVARGVTKGLEGAVRILMPVLALLLVVLIGYGMTTGHFGEALTYMFNPDWSKLTAETVLAALGHAFFTLSLGMGIMMAYGSYLGKEIDLIQTARTVIIMDTVIALGAGLAIFPIVFANSLDVASGPGLIFVTLPLAFGNMGGGTILGLMFFLLLTFAALTSAISLLEPVVEFIEERTPLSRVMATVVAGVGAWLLGIAALLSFNVWSEPLLFELGVFDLLDTLTSKIMLPLTGLGAILFTAWCLERSSVEDELGLSATGKSVWNIIARYIAPAGVIAVFVTGLI
ncbi:transporter [Vreelandella olivaria]|uniref:Transporter n=1 Tax=Vreelandella olivaria TaxID=390919 RepID=A0ABM7GVD8_9GAMM|nr:transporter [Halomonas olivaria]